MLSDLTIFIPALKKTVAFQDDLVKKIAGISLIQRTIDKAIELGVGYNRIHLLTDSEEIRLIAERNSVEVLWNPDLTLDDLVRNEIATMYMYQAVSDSKFVMLLSPYAPLITKELVCNAYQALIRSDKLLLQPVKKAKRYYDNNDVQAYAFSVFSHTSKTQLVESKAFVLMSSEMLIDPKNHMHQILPWTIPHDMIEIDSYHDWWVCEKLLTRKRIVFRVIGNERVGMGHIYRSLSLAHEISDHEILFVSDKENTVAVNKLAGYDYWLGIYDRSDIVANIINLKPDLVINDILSTRKDDVLPLKKAGIKVVNFEDLGSGVRFADLVINELYDVPQISGVNILWGHRYFFVRDEFHNARPHSFKEKIDAILISFGGTDQHDLTYKTYKAIMDYCQKNKIHINIVTGGGYANYGQLHRAIDKNKYVTLTSATETMSRVMEKSQLAIVSNGRTVYELAHMNIPALVISQHEREKTHEFSCTENGFISLGMYKSQSIGVEVLNHLKILIEDVDYRHTLFNRTKDFNFNVNKSYVLKKIFSLLEYNG